MNTLNFYHQGDITVDQLIERIREYYPDANFETLKRAYQFAERAHRGQKRSSGEDYIIHPINVALTLCKLRMDLDSIKAGLLHDVIEDCEVTEEELKKNFNPTVATLVAALTKISKIEFKTKEENQAENFRKMVVAMAKDIRVIIVKLADRMHNMRTLQYISPQKQKKIAQETLDIYVPLAGRLGIHSVKAELEDLCLRYLNPDVYYALAEKVAMKKSEREEYIARVVSIIQEKLLEYSVSAVVKGRPKHFYSIYKKLSQRNVEFEQIQDMLAFRVIVNNITECYKTLGVIHSSFTPIPGRFKDYIAIPKINSYQSLHTTVIGPNAERIEIQIRTHEMDEVAETGVAAHWLYKEGTSSKRPNLAWIQDLVEFNKSVQNNVEFMDAVKSDLDIGGIFVFTPDGDVKELQVGSTPLDFAYAVHTDVGNQCIGAKINSKIVPLKYRLKSGDVVEILTSKTQSPSKDWLNLVRSSKAKTKIKQWLLKNERDKSRKIGLDLLEKSLKLYGLTFKQLEKSGELAKILKNFNCKNEDELYVFIGSGRLNIKDVIKLIPQIQTQLEGAELPELDPSRINTELQKIKYVANKSSHQDNAVIVQGIDGILVRMARCCNPIPGDPIMGFVTRGRGVTVHTIDCNKASRSEEERNIQVSWNSDFKFKHPVSVRVITMDRPGVLALISKTINNLNVNIRSAIAKSLPDQKGNFIFEVEVKDYSELIKIMNAIKSINEVLNVIRI